MTKPKKEEPLPPHKTRDRDWCRELAERCIRQEVWGTWFLREGDARLLPNIMLPLAFSEQEYIDWLTANNVVHFYAELKDRFPTAINGYPIFSSCAIVTKDEWAMIREEWERIENAMKGKNPEGGRPAMTQFHTQWDMVMSLRTTLESAERMLREIAKAEREKRGWSIRDLSTRTSIDEKLLKEVEDGMRRIEPDVAQALRKVFRD